MGKAVMKCAVKMVDQLPAIGVRVSKTTFYKGRIYELKMLITKYFSKNRYG